MGDTTDDLILNFLREAGVSLDEELSSLGDLDTDGVTAACSLCLNVILEARGEEFQRFPKKLSSNPGVRFRTCTALANGISALGFPGEIGFNHFLYPSEAETRRLMLFLVDLMPKGSGDADGAGGALGGGMVSFDEQVRQALQAALRVPWVPLAWQTHRRPIRGERADYLRKALAKAGLAAAKRAERQAAKEARLQSLSTDGKKEVKMSGGFGEAPPGWSEHGSSPSGARLLRPYTNRTSLFGVDVDAGDGAAATDKQDDETPIQRLERGEREKLQALRGELDDVYNAIEEQRKLLEEAMSAEQALTTAVKQLEGEAQQASNEQDRFETANAVRKRALELAADPEGSRTRLQKAVAQSAAALMTLAEEWEGHRGPLLEEIREAQRSRQLRREGAVAKMSKVKQMRLEMRSMVGELQTRDETTSRLQAELAKAKGAARSTYTERILDVVRNLRKQKAGIEQILGDIRDSQKEVNTLSETLQRSFSAADEVRERERGIEGAFTDPAHTCSLITHLPTRMTHSFAGDLPRRGQVCRVQAVLQGLSPHARGVRQPRRARATDCKRGGDDRGARGEGDGAASEEDARGD